MKGGRKIIAPLVLIVTLAIFFTFVFTALALAQLPRPDNLGNTERTEFFCLIPNRPTA